jgi:hypothetical protein
VNVQAVTDPDGHVLWTSPPCPAAPTTCLCPHPPHHPDLRTPRRPDPCRPRLPGRQPMAHHRAQPTTRRGTQPHPAHRQPCPPPPPEKSPPPPPWSK